MAGPPVGFAKNRPSDGSMGGKRMNWSTNRLSTVWGKSDPWGGLLRVYRRGLRTGKSSPMKKQRGGAFFLFFSGGGGQKTFVWPKK